MIYGREDELISIAIFQMIWLVIGMILIGSFALSFLDRYLMTNSGSVHQFQIFKNKDEELVENMEQDVFEDRWTFWNNWSLVEIMEKHAAFEDIDC